MNTQRGLAALFEAALLAITMFGCSERVAAGSDAGTDGRWTGAGGTSSVDACCSSGPDAAKVHPGDGSSCAALEKCTAYGGRGNVCGGVISGPHMLYGSGFEKYEGARVVAPFNHTTVRDGSFKLDAGDYAGCPAKSVAYRIDVSPNGHCDDGTDLVFVVPTGTGPDLYLSGSDHGTPSTCTEFPPGYDLDLAVEPGCFHSCGSIIAALFENGARVGDNLGIYFDVTPPLDYTFVGALTPGHEYELRYNWSGRNYCTGTAPLWRRTFTAGPGITTIPIVGNDTAEPGPCLPN